MVAWVGLEGSPHLFQEEGNIERGLEFCVTQLKLFDSAKVGLKLKADFCVSTS